MLYWMVCATEKCDDTTVPHHAKDGSVFCCVPRICEMGKYRR